MFKPLFIMALMLCISSPSWGQNMQQRYLQKVDELKRNNNAQKLGDIATSKIDIDIKIAALEALSEVKSDDLVSVYQEIMNTSKDQITDSYINYGKYIQALFKSIGNSKNSQLKKDFVRFYLKTRSEGYILEEEAIKNVKESFKLIDGSDKQFYEELNLLFIDNKTPIKMRNTAILDLEEHFNHYKKSFYGIFNAPHHESWQKDLEEAKEKSKTLPKDEQNKPFAELELRMRDEDDLKKFVLEIIIAKEKDKNTAEYQELHKHGLKSWDADIRLQSAQELANFPSPENIDKIMEAYTKGMTLNKVYTGNDIANLEKMRGAIKSIAGKLSPDQELSILIKRDDFPDSPDKYLAHYAKASSSPLANQFLFLLEISQACDSTGEVKDNGQKKFNLYDFKDCEKELDRLADYYDQKKENLALHAFLNYLTDSEDQRLKKLITNSPVQLDQEKLLFTAVASLPLLEKKNLLSKEDKEKLGESLKKLIVHEEPVLRQLSLQVYSDILPEDAANWSKKNFDTSLFKKSHLTRIVLQSQESWIDSTFIEKTLKDDHLKDFTFQKYSSHGDISLTPAHKSIAPLLSNENIFQQIKKESQRYLKDGKDYFSPHYTNPHQFISYLKARQLHLKSDPKYNPPSNFHLSSLVIQSILNEGSINSERRERELLKQVVDLYRSAPLDKGVDKEKTFKELKENVFEAMKSILSEVDKQKWPDKDISYEELQVLEKYRLWLQKIDSLSDQELTYALDAGILGQVADEGYLKKLDSREEKSKMEKSIRQWKIFKLKRLLFLAEEIQQDYSHQEEKLESELCHPEHEGLPKNKIEELHEQVKPILKEVKE